MMKLKKTHKKSIVRVYFKQIMLLIAAIFFVGVGVFAQSSKEAPETYKITLPQKVDGVKKIEYVMNDKSMGSTSGKETINAERDSVLNFLVQVEPEDYSQLRVKDVKINSKEGKALNLMQYMYNRNGELIKVALSENDIMDPNQTYITSDYKVDSNDILSLSDLKKDTFNAVISLDSKDYIANESLDISYTLGKDDKNQTPLYNEKNNSFEIKNVTVGTPITLKVNTKEDFSKSELEILSGENKIIPFSDGSFTLPAIRSDLDITVKNVHKNEYSLSFGIYEDLLFEYKKQGSDADFVPASSEPLKVISGESYDIKCTTKGNDVLSNKEITANGLAIKKANDVYSISNIKEDIKVDVTAVGDSYYSVSLPSGDCGLTVTDESDKNIITGKAKYGESFNFKIKANEGYERNITDALIYAVPTKELENGNYDAQSNSEESDKYLLTPSVNGIYSISDVKEPVSLIVKNLFKDSYRVRFPDGLVGASYKIEPSEGVSEISQNLFSVTRGSKILVTLTTDEGKSLENVTLGCNNSDIIVSRNGNTYTIENITDDSNIVINNIEDKKCNVTFDSDGIICEDENGSVFSKNTINMDYKGSQRFKIRLNDGYKANSDIALNIKSGKATLSKLTEENSYEISNITENTELSVSGIQVETFSVKLDSLDSSAVFTSTKDGSALPTLNTVEYGKNLEFRVNSKDKLSQTYSITSSEKSSEIVTLDSATNKFMLKNVTSNVTLSAIPVYNTPDGSELKRSPKSVLSTKSLENSENENSENPQTRASGSITVPVYMTLGNTSENNKGKAYYLYHDNYNDTLDYTQYYKLYCKTPPSKNFTEIKNHGAGVEGTPDMGKIEFDNFGPGLRTGYYEVTYRVESDNGIYSEKGISLALNGIVNGKRTPLKKGDSFKPAYIKGNSNTSVTCYVADMIRTYVNKNTTEVTVKIQLLASSDPFSQPKFSEIALANVIDVSATDLYSPYDTATVNTYLVDYGKKLYFYPQLPDELGTNPTLEHPPWLTLTGWDANRYPEYRTNEYEFGCTRDVYNENASYTNITGGWADPLFNSENSAITYRKRLDTGNYEGTYNIKIKGKFTGGDRIANDLKAYFETPHWPNATNRNNLITSGKTRNTASISDSNISKASFEVLSAESKHSTSDPGAEELVLSIKITITPSTAYSYIGGSNITLFNNIDFTLGQTKEEITYDVDLFEEILKINKNTGEKPADGLKFDLSGSGCPGVSQEFDRPVNEATVDMVKNGANNSKIKLTSTINHNRPTGTEPTGTKAIGDFDMKFSVTAPDDTSITPQLVYISPDGTHHEEPITAGKYSIITNAGTQDQIQGVFYNTKDVYNRITLNITNYDLYETSVDDIRTTYYLEIKGSCTLEECSCGLKNNSIGSVFKGKSGEQNDVSSITYRVGRELVNSTITFENPGNAEFKKVTINNEEETITEPEAVDRGNTLNFNLYANPGYKFQADPNTPQQAINCIKVDGKPVDQGNYIISVLEYSADKDFVKYSIRGISKENLTISVNPHMIDYIKFIGEFGGKNSVYKTLDGISFNQHTFRINEDNFGFIVTPSEEAEGNKAKKCRITIGTKVSEIDVAEMADGSSQNYSTEDNKFSMQLTYHQNQGIEIVLGGIKTDFKITFDYDLKNIPITFNGDGRGSFAYSIASPLRFADDPESEGTIQPISHTTTKQIKYGKKLSFTVIPNDDSVDVSNIIVTANGASIYMVNGLYTIKSVTSEQNIEVKNISTITKDVTFTKYDHIFFKDLESNTYAEKVPVEYDGEISFRVSTSDTYSESEGNLTVMAELASGKILTFGGTDENDVNAIYNRDNNSYTLKDIKENARIYIKDLSPNKYEIIFRNESGLEYYNQYGTSKLDSYKQEVSHGESFSFKVVAKEGYDISNIKIYDQQGSSGNPTRILPAKDVYTISNITSDHKITAEDATVSKCKIEFRTLTGASCIDSSGNTIDSHIEVNYGSNYKFKLSLDKAYNKSNPTVNIKGVAKPLSRNSDGTYTIPNIQENKIIEITNVTKNSYTATFKDAEGVIYKTAKNKPFTGTQQVEYDSNLYFKISLMDAYDKSSPWVLLNGDKTLVENGGVYSLENIRDDVVVTVKNVVKNPEEVGISDISNIPEEVSSEDDIGDVVKATQTYMSLSDEEKEQVTNVDDLKKAQENAGRLNHASNDVEISGIDWNIKLIVNPLNDDKEKMKSFEEKIDRRSLFSLYEIHLVDLLTGKDYEVPYGQKVSVILPAPDLTGCTNEVVAHEKSSGSIEYLDLNIVDNRAQFQTSSFSMFGIAAKRIQNYVENPSDMKISVNSLVDNEEDLKSLLGDGLVSQLGKLIDDDNTTEKNSDNNTTDGSGNDSTKNDSTSTDSTDGGDSEIKKLLGGIDLEDTYNWMMDNELAAVIVILLIGSLLIWLLLALARKKKKEEETKTNK